MTEDQAIHQRVEDAVICTVEYRGKEFTLMRDPDNTELFLICTEPECWYDTQRWSDSKRVRVGGVIMQLLQNVNQQYWPSILWLVLEASREGYLKGRARGRDEAYSAAQGHMKFLFAPIVEAIKETHNDL